MSGLYQAFGSIKSEKEFNDFLRDLCTPAEIKALDERWKMAKLLYTTNLAQMEIAKKVGGSESTVNRVARFLYTEKFGGYRDALAKLYPLRAETLKKNQPGRLSTASRRHHA